MSLATWWAERKHRRTAKAIARHRKRIKNKFGFGEDRQRAIEFFRSLGGRDGASGLLERFMVNIDHTIRDEEEKEQVFKTLSGLDPGVVVPAIEDFLNRRDAPRVPVTWPLKLLATVASPAEAVAAIRRALERMGTSYTQDPERKVLLVSSLADYSEPGVTDALVPFLRDHRDEVQLEALSALTRRKEEGCRETLLTMLVEPETPPRLRSAIAEALQTLGWDVKGFRKKVEEVLPAGMFVDRSGHIKGRTPGAGGGESDEQG
jgi:hypothetical protein